MRPLLPLFLSLLCALPALASPSPGDRLPELSLARANDSSTRALWTPGKISVVSFCAFWCDTWKEQSRRLTNCQNQTRGLPVDWKIVSVDGRWSDKSREAGWNAIARESLLDAGGHVTDELGIHAVPTTLVVDENGRVRLAVQGIARSDKLLKCVRSILGQGKDSPGQMVPMRLVFDDFPSRDAKLDDRLLDILRAQNIRAILCGSSPRRAASPAIMRRAQREGHELRAPFGNPSRSVLDPFDWKRPSRDELARRILNGAAPSKILLLHAGVSETLDALPDLLASLRRRGLL